MLPSVEAPLAAEELDDRGNAVVVEAPSVRTTSANVEPMESQKISVPELGPIKTGPTLSQVPSTPEWMAGSSDRLPIGERGKAPATSIDDGPSTDFMELFDVRILVGESALVNQKLPK